MAKLLVGLMSSFVTLAAASLAQTPANAPKPSADYSKEAIVVQKLHVAVSFDRDGKATREYSGVVQVLSEAGAQHYGVLNFHYAGANEDVEIVYVRVRKADGTVMATPAENVQDMPSEITRSAPFYSDLREKHVAVKGLSPGATLEYLVRIRLKNPPIPGQFWFEYNFERDSVVLEEQLSAYQRIWRLQR